MSKATSFQKRTSRDQPQGLLNRVSDILLAQTTTPRKPQSESFAPQLLRMFSRFLVCGEFRYANARLLLSLSINAEAVGAQFVADESEM